MHPGAQSPPSADNTGSGWTRRRFVAAAGVTALVGNSAHSLIAAEGDSTGPGKNAAIDFPASYLYCAPTNSGISVRVQMECRGCLTDLASGDTDEYVMGVMAKTGLMPIANTGKIAPGYDYWIIFSKSHVFTKRSHSSAYLNNPTVLEHKNFGEADWRLHRAAAEPLRSPAEIRRAIEQWQRMTATTVFTSADGARRYTIEYPVKWADFSLKTPGFRVETGPVFLLDPDKQRVGSTPAFEDFQWAHFDYNAFDRVRCMIEQPTSIFADATFTPPAEHGRENRENAAFTEGQIKEIQGLLNTEGHISASPKAVAGLLTTDHYSRAIEMPARHELFALAH